MNILDLAILAIIAVSIAFGLKSGLISSAINVAGLLISWICAAIMHPALSRWLVENTSLLDTIVHYTEGAASIFSLEAARTPVALASSEFVSEVITKAEFPEFFNALLQDNILGQVYSANGLSTMADYFNYTLAFTVLNILSFLLILIVLFLLFTIINSVISGVFRFPILRQFDSLLGGAFGLVRGVIIMEAAFMIVPIVLAVINISFVKEMIDTSLLGSLFYDHNLLLGVIKSVIY
ncbi:MAG: hypothetical protein E7334_10710 [Clostridiales bacterium]|nr:hypothetical protein [Clostridiales bacterium]